MSSKRIWLVAWVLGWLSACFEAKDLPPAPGGESNFLRDCDGQCGDGLSCVCGVCTRKCTSDKTCSGLGSNVVCMNDAIGDTRACDASERNAAPAVCDSRCVADRECGDGLTCQAGLCREKRPAAEMSSNLDATLPADAPLVMLLVDTSGSLENMPACECTSSTDCTNCEPDCSANEQNAWFTVLASLTGSYANFGCELHVRDGTTGSRYDEPYTVPNHRLSASSTQRGDGVLGLYGTRIQFGLATFDGEYTYRGGSDLIETAMFDRKMSESELGMWSYPALPPGERVRPDGTVVGRLLYPGVPSARYVDSGIRGMGAGDGALTLPALDAPFSLRSQQLRDQLQRARPYGGTPIASALDDLYFFFNDDELGRSVASTRKRHVVVLTDGAPDPDFRDLDCGCTTREECGGVDPGLMSCPYPTAGDATRHLRCGFGESSCTGKVDSVRVVVLRSETPALREALQPIAAEGGGAGVRFARDQAELRAALVSTFDDIVAGR